VPDAQSLTTDTSWFYSSLAQVSAAIVGLLGGFLTLRLINYINEWRELKNRVGDLQPRWADARLVNRRPKAAPSHEQVFQETRLWQALKSAIAERDAAAMPREILLAGVVLGLLTGVGVIWPLYSLDAPSTGIQSQYLIPFTALLLAFGVLLYFLARQSLAELKGVELHPEVRRQLEQEALDADFYGRTKQAEEPLDT
jgi:hypothetical protein